MQRPYNIAFKMEMKWGARDHFRSVPHPPSRWCWSECTTPEWTHNSSCHCRRGARTTSSTINRRWGRLLSKRWFLTNTAGSCIRYGHKDTADLLKKKVRGASSAGHVARCGKKNSYYEYTVLHRRNTLPIALPPINWGISREWSGWFLGKPRR